MLRIQGLGASMRELLASAASPAESGRATDPRALDPTTVDPTRGRRGETAAAPFRPEVAPERRPPTETTAPRPTEDKTREAGQRTARPTPPAPGDEAERPVQVGSRDRTSGFLAQRIAQELPSSGDAPADQTQSAGAGISALARRAANSLYGFVREALHRGLGGSPDPKSFIEGPYQGGVDLEA